jgi:tetratricopeptide (TPR) repeat protein
MNPGQLLEKKGVVMNRGRNFLSAALLVFLLGGSLGCGTMNLLRLKYDGYKPMDKGHYPEAAATLEKGLDQARTSKIKINFMNFNERISGAFLNNLGHVYEAMGQYDRSLECYQQALAIFTELKRRRPEAEQLRGLGWVYLNLGHYDRALEYNQKALAIIREERDCFLEGALLSNLGWLYFRMDRYDRAREYYQEALAIHRAWCIQPFNRPFELRNRGAEAIDLNGLGCIYKAMGQHGQAREFLQQALAINRKIKDRSGEGHNLNNLGEVYRHLGQYDLARQALEESAKIAHEVGNPGMLWGGAG